MMKIRRKMKRKMSSSDGSLENAINAENVNNQEYDEEYEEGEVGEEGDEVMVEEEDAVVDDGWYLGKHLKEYKEKRRRKQV